MYLEPAALSSLFLMEIHAWKNLTLLYMFILSVLYLQSEVVFDHHKPVWIHLGSEHLVQGWTCSSRLCTGPTISSRTHCLFFILIIRHYTSRHSEYLVHILSLVVSWTRKWTKPVWFTFLKPQVYVLCQPASPKMCGHFDRALRGSHPL